MEYFKKFLGFLLLASVVWLLWVLGLQLGMSSVALVLLALLHFGFGFWILGSTMISVKSQKTRRAGRIIFILASAVALSLMVKSLNFQKGEKVFFQNENPGEESGWINYSPLALEQSKKEGRIIVLDFTAAWCLTCQVNERVAFENPQVRKKFKELNAVLMKADWTNRNSEVTDLLASFGKNSIPFYVVYPQDPRKEPIILPELITARIVLNALEEALFPFPVTK